MRIVFLALLPILTGAVVWLRIIGGGRFPWLQFYTKGKESGFTFHEINLLRGLAVEGHLESPIALFWSIKQLDRSIKELILKMRARGEVEDADPNHLLSKLFDLRKKVEFDLPRYKVGIRSSRNIVARQPLKLRLPEKGSFTSLLVDNQPRYFAVSYPQGPALPEGFSWKGREIGVSFWRAEDAGYSFKSRVVGDFLDRDYPILHIQHADSLVRTQMRRSVRAPMNHPALLFPLSGIGQANETVEDGPGLRCRIKDLSEGGAAILVGGKTRAGLPLKLQLEISGRTVVMCGVVRGVSYSSRKNQSTLHIQAVPLSARTRDHILTYVYNLFGEQEGAAGSTAVGDADGSPSGPGGIAHEED